MVSRMLKLWPTNRTLKRKERDIQNVCKRKSSGSHSNQTCFIRSAALLIMARNNLQYQAEASHRLRYQRLIPLAFSQWRDVELSNLSGCLKKSRTRVLCFFFPVACVCIVQTKRLFTLLREFSDAVIHASFSICRYMSSNATQQDVYNMRTVHVVLNQGHLLNSLGMNVFT